MFRTVAMRALLGAALIITVPAAAAAQERPTTPEGTTWNLVSYAAGGELTQVPWYVDATLVLEDGRAHGSAGCNSFGSTGYELSGDTLTIGQVGAGDVGCPDAWMDVETGYMAALPATARWGRDTGPTDVGLYLYDETGDIILTYARSVASLTRADVYALATQLDALRDRIKDLERQVKRLKDR